MLLLMWLWSTNVKSTPPIRVDKMEAKIVTIYQKTGIFQSMEMLVAVKQRRSYIKKWEMCIIFDKYESVIWCSCLRQNITSRNHWKNCTLKKLQWFVCLFHYKELSLYAVLWNTSIRKHRDLQGSAEKPKKLKIVKIFSLWLISAFMNHHYTTTQFWCCRRFIEGPNVQVFT